MKRWIATVALSTLAAVVISGVVLLLLPDRSIWTGPFRVAGPSTELQGIACTPTALCITFANDSRTYLWRQSRWEGGPLLGWRRGEVPSGASCTGSVVPRCFLSGDEGQVAEIVGSDVVRYFTLARDGDDVIAVSCANWSFCIAVTLDGAAFGWDGVTWRALHIPTDGAGLNNVSCSRQRLCALAEASGRMAVYDAGRWRSEAVFSSLVSASQVSCVASVCVAIGLSGNWAIYSHGVWNRYPAFEGDQSSGYTTTMLSCPTAYSCVAASTNDLLYRLSGRKWHEVGYLFRQSVLSRWLEELVPTPAVSVSCPSKVVCLAVDGSGEGYVDRTGR